MKYFTISLGSSEVPLRVLGAIRACEWKYLPGESIPVCVPARVGQPPQIEVASAGPLPAFSIAGADFTPVLRRDVAAAILELAGHDITPTPALIDGDAEPVVIANVHDRIDALDHGRSSIERFKTGSMKGNISSVPVMRLRLDVAAGHHLFRLTEGTVRPVVSETMRELIESFGPHYLRFTRAS